jgi:hypothetical protein
MSNHLFIGGNKNDKLSELSGMGNIGSERPNQPCHNAPNTEGIHIGIFGNNNARKNMEGNI